MRALQTRTTRWVGEFQSSPAFQPGLYLLLAALASWLCVFLLFNALDTTLMRSDVLGYWRDAQKLGEDIDHFHLPGYPALIAVGHGLLPWLDVGLLMQLLGLVLWLISVVNVFLILRALRLSRAWQGALIYALFPFVSLYHVVFPIADSLVFFLLTAGLLSYLKDRKVLLILALAAVLLVHKASWPFVAMIALVGLREKRLNILDVLLIGLPLVVYWLYGAQRFSDALWIVRANADKELARTHAPIFDGLYGTLVEGGLSNLFKFVLLTSCFALAVLLLVARPAWQKAPVLLAVIIPVLALAVILNEYEIWAMMRYSRLLVLPLWLYLHERDWQVRGIRLQPLYVPFGILAFVSQLVFTYYAANLA